LDEIEELITRNRVTEDFTLYSDTNKIIFSIRKQIMDSVSRQMAQWAVKEVTDNIVNK